MNTSKWGDNKWKVTFSQLLYLASNIFFPWPLWPPSDWQHQLYEAISTLLSHLTLCTTDWSSFVILVWKFVRLCPIHRQSFLSQLQFVQLNFTNVGISCYCFHSNSNFTTILSWKSTCNDKDLGSSHNNEDCEINSRFQYPPSRDESLQFHVASLTNCGRRFGRHKNLCPTLPFRWPIRRPIHSGSSDTNVSLVMSSQGLPKDVNCNPETL